MNDKTIGLDQTEVILTYQVSDEALEAAAGTVKDKTGSYTLSFCSGLDTCPAILWSDKNLIGSRRDRRAAVFLLFRRSFPNVC